MPRSQSKALGDLTSAGLRWRPWEGARPPLPPAPQPYSALDFPRDWWPFSVPETNSESDPRRAASGRCRPEAGEGRRETRDCRPGRPEKGRGKWASREGRGGGAPRDAKALSPCKGQEGGQGEVGGPHPSPSQQRTLGHLACTHHCAQCWGAVGGASTSQSWHRQQGPVLTTLTVKPKACGVQGHKGLGSNSS